MKKPEEPGHLLDIRPEAGQVTIDLGFVEIKIGGEDDDAPSAAYLQWLMPQTVEAIERAHEEAD